MCFLEEKIYALPMISENMMSQIEKTAKQIFGRNVLISMTNEEPRHGQEFIVKVEVPKSSL